MVVVTTLARTASSISRTLFSSRANPADGILGIHDGLGIENIGIKPGEVPRIIGGACGAPVTRKAFLRRECAVDRVAGTAHRCLPMREIFLTNRSPRKFNA
jgi:hypothetical protein